MIDWRLRLGTTLAAVAVAGCNQGSRDAPVAPDNESNAEVSAPPAAAAPAAPAAGPQSRFTSLDVANCKLIERNEEEAGYARHRCTGVAGYQLELVESDLRQTIELFRPGGKVESLELSSLVAGGGFSSVGKTAEWRGSDPARPRTLTVRYGVNEDPDPNVAPRSYLVVTRLESPACVVARVSPGPEQSGEARAVADRTQLPPCITR